MAKVTASNKDSGAVGQSWADTVFQNDMDAETADEVENALDEVLEQVPEGGRGSPTIKRVEYGSAGSRGANRAPSLFRGEGPTMPLGMGGEGRSQGFRPGESPSLNTAVARYGRAAVRRALGNGRR